MTPTNDEVTAMIARAEMWRGMIDEPLPSLTKMRRAISDLAQMADMLAAMQAEVARLTERVDELTEERDRFADRIDELAEARLSAPVTVQAVAEERAKWDSVVEITARQYDAMSGLAESLGEADRAKDDRAAAACIRGIAAARRAGGE